MQESQNAALRTSHWFSNVSNCSFIKYFKIFIYSSDSSDSMDSSEKNHPTCPQKITQPLNFILILIKNFLSTFRKSNLTHLKTDVMFQSSVLRFSLCFLLRGSVIFVVERWHDFFSRGFIIFVCGEVE